MCPMCPVYPITRPSRCPFCPFVPALCERGRICRACAVAQGRVGFKDYNDNNDIKDAPKKGQWDGLLTPLRRSRPISPNWGKAPRGCGPATAFAGCRGDGGWGHFHFAPTRRKGGIAGHEVPWRPRCASFVRWRSSRKIAKHPSGSVAA